MQTSSKGVPIHSSLRTKLFWVMLSMLLGLVILLTAFSTYSAYNAMYEQLITNKELENDWLAARYDWLMSEYLDQLNPFEVNKELKQDLLAWCEGDIGYQKRNHIISQCNAIMSQNADITEMRMFNLVSDEMLVVQRSGATMQPTDDSISFWEERPATLQSNLVLQENDGEILVSHLLKRFENNEPLVLITIYARQSAFPQIEQETPEYSSALFVFNDNEQLLYTRVPANSVLAASDARDVLQSENADVHISYDGHYWFSQGVSRDKITIIQAVPHGMITSVLWQNVYAGLIAAGAAVIAAIGFAFLFSKIFSRPIVALAQKMKTVTIKDYQAGDLVQRHDEVGLLESSFDMMVQHNRKLIEQEYQTRIEKRSAQLRALQAQINPHFLYNTLQVIGGMALKNNLPDINQVASDLSDILRYSLSSGKEMVKVQKELQYLQCYLAIQNRRFGERIEINIDVDQSLMHCMLPKLIIQPLVENSLQHGFASKGGKWMLKITISQKADHLMIVVEDNGVGMSKMQLEDLCAMLGKDTENTLGNSSHIGLANVHSRIRLKFGVGYGLTVRSTEGIGTQVALEMPIQRGEDDAL